MAEVYCSQLQLIESAVCVVKINLLFTSPQVQNACTPLPLLLATQSRAATSAPVPLMNIPAWNKALYEGTSNTQDDSRGLPGSVQGLALLPDAASGPQSASASA